MPIFDSITSDHINLTLHPNLSKYQKQRLKNEDTKWHIQQSNDTGSPPKTENLNVQAQPGSSAAGSSVSGSGKRAKGKQKRITQNIGLGRKQLGTDMEENKILAGDIKRVPMENPNSEVKHHPGVVIRKSPDNSQNVDVLQMTHTVPTDKKGKKLWLKKHIGNPKDYGIGTGDPEETFIHMKPTSYDPGTLHSGDLSPVKEVEFQRLIDESDRLCRREGASCMLPSTKSAVKAPEGKQAAKSALLSKSSTKLASTSRIKHPTKQRVKALKPVAKTSSKIAKTRSAAKNPTAKSGVKAFSQKKAGKVSNSRGKTATSTGGSKKSVGKAPARKSIAKGAPRKVPTKRLNGKPPAKAPAVKAKDSRKQSVATPAVKPGSKKSGGK
ncbi:hypothetical protein BDQ17DRAFT_1422420 [Cyathus striatus]|nr:hypothetical protein BDQ17DRAFT_1422420 [Cyathus striatus]